MPMLTTTQVTASVSCWPRRCDHERHHSRGLPVAGTTSPVGRVCTNCGQIACGTLGRPSGRRRSTATPPFRSTDEPFRPVRRVMILRCSSLQTAIGHQRRAAPEDNPAICTNPQLGAYQPFRPRRAANSSTALLNTRQVAATHPANFAGLTAVGFRGQMMRHAARSSPGFSSTLIRASWAISPEASSIRFGTGISWSSQ
jgi:hypothetical protein